MDEPATGVDEPSFSQGVVSWRVIVERSILLVLVLAAAVALLSWMLDRGFAAFSILTSLASGITLPLMLLRTGVLIDHRGVQVWSLAESQRGAWRWDELRELCLAKQQGGPWTLGVRPRGSVWDVPGPSAPSVPPMRGLKDDVRRDELVAVLEHYCAVHDVPLTRTVDGLGSAPPGSHLRFDS